MALGRGLKGAKQAGAGNEMVYLNVFDSSRRVALGRAIRLERLDQGEMNTLWQK